ncbi:hypothetical protein B0T22DRAFT_453331 [Podospora appendiculata]|uniref:Uncharacterized protein n=1 Tax=Podospora appendiculata TaxID=314037 RepID=A0AAE1CHP3_9PEZI|nr:hypothetical protein B0T22DRAFT_453331 [Podospora appendiculata]
MCYYKKLVFGCGHSEFLECVKRCSVAEALERGDTTLGCTQLRSHGYMAVRVESDCKTCIERQATKAAHTTSIKDKIQTLRDELEKLKKISREFRESLSEEEQRAEVPKENNIQRAEEQGRQLAEQFGEVGVSEERRGSSEDGSSDSKSSGERPKPQPVHADKMPETKKTARGGEKNIKVVKSGKQHESRLRPPKIVSSRH